MAIPLPKFIQQRGTNAYNEITNPNQNPLLSGIKATGQAFGAVTDTASKALNAIPGVSGISNLIGQGVQKGVDALSNTSAYKNYAAANPQTTNFEKTLQGAEGLGNISGGILTAQAAASLAQKGVNALKPKELTTEQLSEQAGGWKPGTKVKFDTALAQKDAAGVQSMLKDVPAEYQTRFSKEISNILGGGTAPEATNVYRYEGGDKGVTWDSVKNASPNAQRLATQGTSVSLDSKSSSMFGDNLKSGSLSPDQKLYDLTKVGDNSNFIQDPLYKQWFNQSAAGSKGLDFVEWMGKKGYAGVKYMNDTGDSVWADLRKGVNPFSGGVNQGANVMSAMNPIHSAKTAALKNVLR